MLSKYQNIYMIGIKGVGMTMLAQLLVAKGKNVSGSDISETFMTDKALKKSGISVYEGLDANNIPVDADLIIYSTAYNEKNNIEVKTALSGRKKVMIYAEALGEMFAGMYGIAVAGSHGKTTTSAWLGYVLMRAGRQPNAMVGAYVPQFEASGIAGQSNLLVVETDEYQNKLKYFNPQGVLLNNIEFDHPDFFSSEEDYANVFLEFIKKIPKKGFLIANFDDPVIKKTANVNCRGKVISYAINEAADYVAYSIKSADSKQYFKVKIGSDSGEEDEESGNCQDFELGDFCIALPGRHNIYNALAVIAASIELDIPLNELREYLEDFSGTARRMEVMGKFHGALIVDDYAHHPTEIKTTLEGAKDLYPDKELVVVFHPHTFTRTKGLFSDFVSSFNSADKLIILDIYGSAREEQGGVHSRDLVEAINKKNTAEKINQPVVYIPTLDECEDHLRREAKNNDVILLMGAGDVFRIGEKLIGKIS
jgi:UDP-N-acetylmuramate--alanine ligase